jgi:hypothetical protein
VRFQPRGLPGLWNKNLLIPRIVLVRGFCIKALQFLQDVVKNGRTIRKRAVKVINLPSFELRGDKVMAYDHIGSKEPL